jgi:hypothetical protein
MATRTLTQFHLIDQEQLKAGKPVLADLQDKVVDNMEYLLLSERLGISAVFPAHRTNHSATPLSNLIARWYTSLIDFCDISAITNDETEAKFSAYVYSDGTATPQVRVVSSAATNNDVSHTGSASTTPHWTDFTHAATFNVLTNDQEDDIQLHLGYDPAGSSGYVWCAGFAIFIVSRA